jgi:hypothetical protein
MILVIFVKVEQNFCKAFVMMRIMCDCGLILDYHTKLLGSHIFIMTHEELKQAQEQAFAPFRDRILEIFLDPEKGLEYFDSLKIPRDRVYEIIAPNSFSLIIKGDLKDKDRVMTFKKLFLQQDGSIEVFHDLLDLMLPESIKQYKREIDELRLTKEWSEIAELSGVDYRRLYTCYLGYFYPSIKTIRKLAAIIKVETLQAIALEIHGEEIKINAITRPNQDRNDILIRARLLDHGARFHIVNGLLSDLEPSALMRISKRAIEIALDLVSAVDRDHTTEQDGGQNPEPLES